jgi:arginyl-tRNA synthetase
MTRPFESLLEGALERAVATGDLRVPERPRCRLEEPDDPGFGDVTCRVAMRLARRLGRPAPEIAATLVRHVSDPEGWIEHVEAAGPGFVNVRASLGFWRAALAAALQGSGARRPDRGRAVLVAAPATAPDVPTRIRSAHVGDVLARLLAADGHEVVRATSAADGLAVPAAVGGATRVVVLHEDGRHDAAAAVKRAVAAAGGPPARTTACAVAPCAVLRRGRPLAGDEAAAALAMPAARFALAGVAAAAPAVLDADRLDREHVDDAYRSVRYALVRIARLGTSAETDLTPLDEPERECLRLVGLEADRIALAARRLEPPRVTAHARAVAAAFHRYYNRGAFESGDATTARARRALAAGVARVLERALALVDAPG